MKRALVWVALFSLAAALALALFGVDSSTWGTDCGDPAHVPPRSDVYGAWTAYRCKDRAAAGASWARCLRRDDYADPRGKGCRGERLCCPAGISP